MKPGQLRILFILTLLVIASYIMLSYKDSFFATTGSNIRLSTIDVRNVNRITISSNDQSIELIKDNGLWEINSSRANQESALSLLNAIASSSSAVRKVSENERNFAGFGIGVNGKDITLKTDSDTSSIGIGNAGLDPSSFYAKNSADPIVYLFSGSVHSLSPLDKFSWYDPDLITVDTNAITKLEVTGKDPYTISKTDSGFELQRGIAKSSITEDAVKPIFEKLATLTAISIATEEQMKQFTSSASKTTVSVSTSSDKTVLVLSSGNESVLVQRNEEPSLFVVQKIDLSSILTPSL